MTSKLIRTVFLGISLILAALVPLTADVWYNSLSAHADANNEIIYNSMHIFSCLFLFLNAQAQKRDFDYVVGLGMVGILLTNMNDYPLLHNIFTGLTLICAIFSMLYYCSQRYLGVNIFMAVGIVMMFLVGYFTVGVYFALAEIVVMYILGVHYLRRIWIGKEF